MTNIATPATPRSTTATTWSIDPSHSSVEFAVKHLMIATVKGKFGAFRGTVRASEADLASAAVEAEIDAASVDTGSEQRDGHLRSPDFFDAAAHPKLVFRGTRIDVDGEDAFTLRGDLTIRGVTHPIELEVEREGEARDPWGKRRVALTARGKLDRTKYGLTWNQALEAGGVLVGDQVKITLNLSLVADA